MSFFSLSYSFYPLHIKSLITTSEANSQLLLNCDISRRNEEKANTIQPPPPPLCFSHLQPRPDVMNVKSRRQQVGIKLYFNNFKIKLESHSISPKLEGGNGKSSGMWWNGCHVRFHHHFETLSYCILFYLVLSVSIDSKWISPYHATPSKLIKLLMSGLWNFDGLHLNCTIQTHFLCELVSYSPSFNYSKLMLNKAFPRYYGLHTPRKNCITLDPTFKASLNCPSHPTIYDFYNKGEIRL